MSSEEITITIPASGAAQMHIENLQASLTKRNAQIERLTQQLAEAQSGEPNQTALSREYKKGWRDAANHLLTTTQQAALALSKVRKDALDVYYEGERKES